MFTKEQLAKWRAEGFQFDSFYDSVAVDTSEPKKKMEITFVSAALVYNHYEIKLKALAENLKSGNAQIKLFENEVFSNELVMQTTKTIRTNSTTTFTLSASLSEFEKLSKSVLEGDFEFFITIEVDGLESRTSEFSLPEIKTNNAAKLYKDVFSAEQFTELKDEIEWVTRFVELESPREYAENYCMQAAERGLSKLLSNTKDFYALNRDNKHLNNVNLSGLTAEDRGRKFQKLGFVAAYIEFNEYRIKKDILHKITGRDNLGTYMYDVLEYTSNKLADQISKLLYNKNGIHIFYLSVSDNFHTLILSINNELTDDITYEIYDQHGLTTSFGKFEDIGVGVLRQSNWTFANQYLNMGPKIGLYPKSITRLWKIQRKV